MHCVEWLGKAQGSVLKRLQTLLKVRIWLADKLTSYKVYHRLRVEILSIGNPTVSSFGSARILWLPERSAQRGFGEYRLQRGRGPI